MKIGQLIGLSVVGLALSTGSAPPVYADGGDATLIHGCVAKDGTTRIVTPSTSCKSSETARHWPTDARIIADETRITNTETKNTTQDSQISAIQTKNTQEDAAIVALQGQNAGGIRVVDNIGQAVGLLIDVGKVLIKSGNIVIWTDISIDAIPDRTAGILFWHTSSNCSGTRYMDGGDQLPEFAFRAGGSMYFPIAPRAELTISSLETFVQGDDLSLPGNCVSFSSTPRSIGVVGTFSLPTFAPPFRVE